MHVIADPLIDIGPDGTARADAYAVVYQIAEPGSGAADLTLGIRYLDELVRHDGHWVIAGRTATTLWSR
jgi:hypothetical protein